MNTQGCESEAFSAQRNSYSLTALGVCISSVAGMQMAHADALGADSSEQGETNNSGTLDQVVVLVSARCWTTSCPKIFRTRHSRSRSSARS